MNKLKTKNYITLFLLIVYNFFFWGEGIGLNLVIFNIMLMVSVIFISPDRLRNKYVIILLAASIYSGACVLIINSPTGITAFVLCIMIFTGFAFGTELKTLIGAFMMCLSSYFLYPFSTMIELFSGKQKSKFPHLAFKYTRLIILPLITFVIFYSIYAFSNPTFNSYSVNFWTWVRDSLSFILDRYPFERIIFIILGFILISGILFYNKSVLFAKIEQLFADNLKRDKFSKLSHGKLNIKKTLKGYLPYLFTFKNQSLINEYRIGIILMISVNALLLILNIIDINFVWLNFNPYEVENLAYFVHEGTYYLIFSILLSSLIILYYFRGNLNFYSKNKLLKFIAYFWIFQNGILAVSLALRNYYYIDFYYALSYKRIGVMLFLVLTFAGLISLIIKLKFKKTVFYLIKFNSWVFLCALLIYSSVNWDIRIAEFNLHNPVDEKIDYSYLLSLSNDVLPLLNEHYHDLNREIDVCKGRYRSTTINGMEYFNKKVSDFRVNYEQHTFLSWNYADYKIHNVLKEQN